ncbi:MAG: hypothetical protein KDK23_02270 [Leptospiraceae bacterium]|nr:hypothetical protein [Leptospiraceae bacterium]
MKSQAEILERIPLFEDRHLPMLRRILENNHAPRWNAMCGDRLVSSDLPALRAFEVSLRKSRNVPASGWSEEESIRFIENMALRSPWFQRVFEDRSRDFASIPSMRREDLVHRLHEIVPLDADLSRLVLNPTSGTTGMPVQVPNDPLGVAHYQPLILEALSRHGIERRPGTDDMAAVQICSQRSTMTYGTVHAAYGGAGFAKINIAPGGRQSLLSEWNSLSGPDAFLQELQPFILTGDPFAFRIYMDYNVDYRPSAVLSTASTLSMELRKEMEEYFQCPVVNMYSTNESGPIAASCAQHPDRFHILAPDIRLETLASSQSLNFDDSGASGTVHITGGRNPLLPLLRYDTGDLATWTPESCSCGASGYLRGLTGRPLVLFRDMDGHCVNPLDFARLLRFVPLRRHRLLQQSDGSLDMYLDPGPFDLSVYRDEIIRKSAEILGELTVRIHPWSEEVAGDYPYRVVA